MRRHASPSSPHRTLAGALALLGAVLLIATPAGAGDPASTAGQQAPAALALAGLDPILLLKGEEVQGDDSIDVVHGLYRYIFTSEEHRARFQADPDRYGIQGDGTCPVYPGIAARPGQFTVYQGRIYAFSESGAMQRFLEHPEKYLDASGQPIGFRDALKVAILLYEGVEAVDVAIPGEVFQVAGRDGSFKTFTVAASTRPVRSQGYLDMIPEHSFSTCPQADVLVIPGGGIDAVVNEADVMAWVRNAAGEADLVLGLSTGTFILARAGLLDGVKATTHGGAVDSFRHFAQRTLVVTGSAHVDAGKVVTSPGGAQGLDASLHALARLAGDQAALKVARYLASSWRPERARPPPPRGRSPGPRSRRRSC